MYKRGEVGLVNSEVQYLDHQMLRGWNLFTSGKLEDLPAFCRGIIDAVELQ
jgi:hypothetical protein